jgi:UDP-glucose 4-epimerase
MFKEKVLLITGGTGSFGNAVLRRFLKTNIQQIRIFSRDEKKQDDMRHESKTAGILKVPQGEDIGPRNFC